VLRSIFLGDPSSPESGMVELVAMEDMAPTGAPSKGPAVGFFLLSLFADLDEVLPRLAVLGVGGAAQVITVSDVRLAVVHDPNGVRVELMDSPAQANVAALSEAGD
jgi:hypothetical protein